MNGYREEHSSCYFHPKEVIIGVCPLCLNERLLILAAKLGHIPSSGTTTPKKPPINLPKIFAFGSLLPRHWKSDQSHPKSDASTSPEDSFISIKFEDNGAVSWEKTVSKSLNQNSNKETKQLAKVTKESSTKETMSVIEHDKPRGSLRWRKRIGHLFQVIQWKRSNKGNMCHMGTKVEGVKVMRKGWIRTLTKRRTRE